MFTTTLPEGFEKAARLPTPRNTYALGKGCLPVTLIQIYLLSQCKRLQPSKIDATPSCQCRATALRLPAGWVRHGVGNHGRDIHWQLERVIENSSMLSSAHGPRRASEPQTGTRVVRMSSTSPLKGILCTPPSSQLNVCLRWHHVATQRSTDTMCICKC